MVEMKIEYFRVRHINENGDIVNTQCFRVDPRLANADDAQVFQQVKTMSDMPAVTMTRILIRLVFLV